MLPTHPLSRRAPAMLGKGLAGTLLALGLAGCAELQKNLPDSLGRSLSLVSAAAPAPAGGAAAPVLLPPNTPPVFTRPPQQLRALLARGTVNGAELLAELRAMRMAAHDQRHAAAMARFMGRMDAAAAPAASGTGMPRLDWNELWNATRQVALDTARAQFDQAAAQIAYQALDSYLATLIDAPDALARETIQLPPGQGLSDAQAQRVVTLAAVVVAARVTNKVLTRAQQDFAGIEAGYVELTERREKAAALLYAALADRSRGTVDPQVQRALSAADLAYLDRVAAGRGVREFANDLGAQNLALQLMRYRDPQAFAQYRVQADGWRRSTQAYVRTIGGVAAFGGLLATFGRQIEGAGRDQSGLVEVGVLGVEFVKEAIPLVKLTLSTMLEGVVLQPVKAVTARPFRFTHAGVTEELGDSGAVFAALRQKKTDGLLVEALFRDEAPGLMYRLYQCDPGETGRMLDAAVPAARREAFARSYQLGEAAAGFAFVNAFTVPSDSVRLRELGDQLLRRDHRSRTDDLTRSLSTVQTAVVNGYSEWSDDQLLRLIFANREGAAARASLQLGDSVVRPVPSMQAVYVYESLIDSCRSLVDDRARPAGPPAAAPPAARTAPRAVPRPAPRPGQPKTQGK